MQHKRHAVSDQLNSKEKVGINEQIRKIADKYNLSRQSLLAIIHEIRPPSSNFKLDEAMNWLENELRRGEQQSKHLNAKATRIGINRTTLYRAATELGVKTVTTGFGRRKRSFWRLKRFKE
jgi:hypothetical protein